jgi:hypothetical protein
MSSSVCEGLSKLGEGELPERVFLRESNIKVGGGRTDQVEDWVTYIETRWRRDTALSPQAATPSPRLTSRHG